jgi:large subunit ribosomal protein L9
MKVLLTNDVNKLGWLGDVVDVADGYARNYLLPQGLARPATDANIKAIAKAKAQRAEQRRLEVQQLERAAQAVDGAEAVIAAAANEQGHLFGSVFKREVADNLRAQGFQVPDDVVALGEHIKEVGTYKVTLEFTDEVKAAVSLVVVPEGADVEAFKAAQSQAAKEAAEKPTEPASPEQPAEEKEQPEGEEKSGAQ